MNDIKQHFKICQFEMNPYDEVESKPNFWLSCMLIKPEAMCKQVRGEQEALYISEAGKTCPTEILEVLEMYNAEGRPLWKPMHMQPIYRMNGFVTREGNGRAKTNAYISGGTSWEKMENRWMLGWICFIEDCVCRVITR